MKAHSAAAAAAHFDDIKARINRRHSSLIAPAIISAPLRPTIAVHRQLSMTEATIAAGQ